jgi:endonuclease YncB( thermonuclease family)
MRFLPPILISSLVLLAVHGAAWADRLNGLVVGVSDGDTITVLDDHRRQLKVRLAGIDAPEKRQDFGNRAKQSLSDLAYKQRVIVDTGKTDRYGRIIGKVTVNGQDVNLEQVRRGLAWHYKVYEREQAPGDRLAYAAAEKVARASKTGLWAMPTPIPPWEFRRAKNTPEVQAVAAP